MKRLINEAEYCTDPEFAEAEIPRAVRMVLFCTPASVDWRVIGLAGDVSCNDVTETAPDATDQE